MHELLRRRSRSRRPVTAPRPQDRGEQRGPGACSRAPGVPREPAARALAEYLIGGPLGVDLPDEYCTSGYLSLVRRRTASTSTAAPLPNTLYHARHDCWIYGGVTLNPLYWPVRAKRPCDHGRSTVPPELRQRGHQGVVGRPGPELRRRDRRGRRRHAGRHGVVLIGMSERTSRQASASSPPRCSRTAPADGVIIAGHAQARAAMHLDTVFTFADRTWSPSTRRSWTRSTRSPCARATGRAASTRPWSASRSSTWSPKALNLKKLRVIETGGDHYPPSAASGTAATTWSAPRRAWFFAYDRNTWTNNRCARPDRGDRDRGCGARSRPWRRALHDLPADPGSGRLLTLVSRGFNGRVGPRCDPPFEWSDPGCRAEAGGRAETRPTGSVSVRGGASWESAGENQ